MKYTLRTGSILAKAFFYLLHFMAICIIVVSPIVIGLSCTHNQRLTQHAYKHPKSTTIAEINNGIHNTIWNIIKNRHLSAPRSNSRITTIAVISLLVASLILTQLGQVLIAGCYSRYHTKAFPVPHKYLHYRIFLI